MLDAVFETDCILNTLQLVCGTQWGDFNLPRLQNQLKVLYFKVQNELKVKGNKIEQLNSLMSRYDRKDHG